MVLVVRYAGQSCVKGHHDQGELQEGPEQTSTSPSEAGLKVQHQIQHGVHGEGGVAREEGLPGFLDFAVIASAFVVLNVALGAVDEAEVRVADAQEMRTQTSYGDFGNVCEGLADGTAKEEATYLLIEGCHVGIPNRGPGLLLQVIDPVEFPCDDREDGDDDPHGAEHSIIYCLTSFQGILDAVIVAVEPSVVRLDGAGLNDQEGQASQKEAKEVEADEQRPLAAALPRVVVERRAAAVLALRDDRLVVLVVLHGAGCGAILPPREDAPQQRTHTQTRGSLPGRGCSGEWRVGPGLGSGGRRECGSAACFQRRRWCFLLPLGASAFFLSQPQIVRKSKRKRAKSRAESCAELRGSRRAGLACAWESERANGQRGRSATFLRSWRLNEWELRGARPLRSASPAPTFPPLAAAAAAAAVVIASGLFSALLFHEVL